ncbi:uncharacterized protein [Oryctolagus cuniculus]|uniref:uncharacterized protein n=1 Tax=Oryctolagus cuniculus TaxID=9986 RepID=UPI0038796945
MPPGLLDSTLPARGGPPTSSTFRLPTSSAYRSRAPGVPLFSRGRDAPADRLQALHPRTLDEVVPEHSGILAVFTTVAVVAERYFAKLNNSYYY